MKIFVVIPLFNEKKHISAVLENVTKYKLPVVVVDDGSTDGSEFTVQDLRIKNVVLLTHGINLGKGSAMKTGAEYAFKKGADAVIFMDSDGQHKANDLPRFVDALESGKYDVVLGSRNLGMGVPLVRYLGNKVASVILGFLFNVYVSDPICGFRALTKIGYEKVKWESNGYGVETEMATKIGKYRVKHTEVPVETIYIDGVKGVTLFNAFGILGEVVKWRFTR
jgi:glycosyltransferase involved in cell wall biosynthesis